MFRKYIKVIIRGYLSILGYEVDHFVKKSTFCQAGPQKSVWSRSPDSDKNPKIVKKDWQNVHEVH